MVMTLGCMRGPTKSTVIQPLGHGFTGLDFVSITPRRKGGQTIECCQVSNDPHGGVVGLYPSYAWDENLNSRPKKNKLCRRGADRHATGIFCRSNNRAGFSISAIGTRAAFRAGRHTAQKPEPVPAR